jgi:hypothetical protein
MIAHNPLHGSGQAELPHPALTSGDNAHAAQGIRMTSTGGRQPAVDQAPHPGPEHVGVLAAPRKGAMPEPADLEPKRMQRHAVGRHAVTADVSAYSPLSTLRRRPRERLRMTRGRYGSLTLYSMSFSFTTPRRSSRRTGE